MTSLEWFFLGTYFLVLLILSIYGSHRYVMAYLYYKYKGNLPAPKGRFEELPRVTVQLPIFNEMYVVERLIEAVCNINYPRERFEIQVLDDSTDETQGIARAASERARAAGHDVVYIHRDNRSGYKAGALQEGLKVARGEFVAVFDADFVPTPDFLLRSVQFFTDEKVGMVQVRWEHLNRSFSHLTQAQAIFLDGHFVIEHTARNRSGRFFNFNGTAGVWRRATIEDAGGWQHDTLTEDLDLSYRAQLKGWQFVYLPEVVSPGRGAGGDERLQEPAAPLGQGLDPDRAQAPAAHPQERSAPRCQGRGVLPPHRQLDLSADDPVDRADAGEHGHPLQARLVRSADARPALLLDRDHERGRVLRRQPAGDRHAALAAGEVPAVHHGAGDRPLHESTRRR